MVELTKREAHRRERVMRCFSTQKLRELQNRDTSSPSMAVVPPVVTLPMMLHGGVAALPVVTPAAIGIRIARAQVLAICVRVELRTIAGIGDNGLCQCRGCESRPDNSRDANQCEFHLGLPKVLNVM